MKEWFFSGLNWKKSFEKWFKKWCASNYQKLDWGDNFSLFYWPNYYQVKEFKPQRELEFSLIRTTVYPKIWQAIVKGRTTRKLH